MVLVKKISHARSSKYCRTSGYCLTYKVRTNIFQRLQNKVNEHLGEEQFGFKKSTVTRGAMEVLRAFSKEIKRILARIV